VGTNVTNPAAPLLKYDTQDLATVVDGASCECGRAGRVVERVDGRLEDYVVLADGTQIGRMDHIFKDMVNIREAQIHQKLPGAITVRVVRNPLYTDEDERALRRETAKRVGAHTRVDVEYVDAIARSSTGKLRFVVSELPGAAVDGRPT
jgi:phenylacetate-CoA ligase